MLDRLSQETYFKAIFCSDCKKKIGIRVYATSDKVDQRIHRKDLVYCERVNTICERVELNRLIGKKELQLIIDIDSLIIDEPKEWKLGPDDKLPFDTENLSKLLLQSRQDVMLMK